MGVGKTEAALYAAYKLMAAGHHYGFYFGLPTRLTSDRIHHRVRKMVEAVVEKGATVRLAHGQFWLSAFEYGGGKELGAGKSWFKPAKRALLLPFAVGTIDQALLSVLKVRHYFVRSFGLAGKVVVLDEVHSYDVYTGTLLDLLVERLLQIGCTVIVLSATLTRRRRSAVFAAPEKVASEQGYPLISVQNGAGCSTIRPAAPEPLAVRVSLERRSDVEVARAAVDRARREQCVVCIANTVAQAHRWYAEVKGEMPAQSFAVGLLHSKYPAWRRQQLEDHWMDRLGKGGDRGRGCVLVATQIVEQSVDIDADYMITELAPTDMVLQRMGRLWRHEIPHRPCQKPEVLIVSGLMSRVQSMEELTESLGKSNSKVYSPYVLWKSHRVWEATGGEVRLPQDIPFLLESTYERGDEGEPQAVSEARADLDKRRERLRRLANAARADVAGFCVMRDDERAATRFNDFPTIDAVLVRSVDSRGSTASLVLVDGVEVSADCHARNPWVSAQLHRNLVSVPAYLLRGVRTPPFLRKHFHDATAVFVVADDGQLLLEGEPTGLRYDDERGLSKQAIGETVTATPSYRERAEELDDIADWEGDFDEFDW